MARLTTLGMVIMLEIQLAITNMDDLQPSSKVGNFTVPTMSAVHRLNVGGPSLTS